MTKWQLRKIKAEQKALQYLKEHDGIFSTFWATENIDRAYALERLDKRGIISEYSTELGYPYGWYKNISDRFILIPMKGWIEEYECKIIKCDGDKIYMNIRDITNPSNKDIPNYEVLRCDMYPEGIDKNLKEGYILYWYIDEDKSIFSYKRKDNEE